MRITYSDGVCFFAAGILWLLVVEPAAAQSTIDVKAGFFDKQQISSPIADPSAQASSEKSTRQKLAMAKDSFAVEPKAPAPAAAAAEGEGSEEAQQAAVPAAGSLNGRNLKVDEQMADALKSAKSISERINGAQVGSPAQAPTSEYLNRAIGAVDEIINEAVENPPAAKPQASHRF